MLNSIHGQSQSPNTASLARWIRATLWVRQGKIHYRMRGNTLHILCEGKTCPEQSTLLFKLLTALQRTDINTVLAADDPPIYQILLYGRRQGMKTPTWTAPIYLNQIEHHLTQFQRLHERPAAGRPGPAVTLAAARGQEQSSTTALVLSNRSLARQGNEAAIAHYLSEVLGALGVAVRVSVKTLPYKPRSVLSIIELSGAPDSSLDAKRLWITCEATYSPDPIVLSEPLAQRLRDLEFEHFHDAVILIQVRGEERPDWGLRVDLTPTHEILREWARWGDAAAIDRLLKQPLADHQIELTTTSLRDATLHLFFSTLSFAGQPAGQAPDDTLVKSIVAPILETLGPQGVQGAALYGSVAGQETPAWVNWLDLPASHYAALAESPMALAQQNDWGAIAYLLNRLINPDLDHYLATGGVRVQVLPRGDLLHIMTDAPMCPSQEQVGPLVSRFFEQLALPQVAGVRVYGRRAGQKRPSWSFGSDFHSRNRLVPEAAPEFAATDAFMNELVAQPGDEVFRQDLTVEDLHNAWGRLHQQLLNAVRTALVNSQLFILASDSASAVNLPPQAEPRHQNAGVTALWVTVGLLLAVQANWGLRWLLQTVPEPSLAQTTETADLPALEQRSLDAAVPDNAVATLEEGAETLSRSLEKWHSETPSDDVFNASGFTSLEPIELPHSEQRSASQGLAAAILSEELPFSTFNSRQLDEKLLLYKRLLETSGPPDVLIMGSSRALRGVDPVALETKLASLGYSDITVFNFGINGATAQVVDLIVRGLLTPDQLPKLIIWADGARAFNSGNLDVTQNGILASEGYQDITRGKLPLAQTYAWGGGQAPQSAIARESQALSLTASYDAVDQWLSDRLAQLIPVYEERDRLKHLTQQGLTTAFPSQSPSAVAMGNGPSTPDPAADSTVQTGDGQSLVDIHGFLPLSVKFNPATYYQTYARVAGAYDSDYADFRIGGQQETALKALLAFTHDQNIPLVFVNLPLTQDYLDDVRLEYEQQFKQYMLSVAVHQGGLIFRDLGEEWLTQHDYFSDPSHLNRYGAYQVSERLAQDPMIPWPQP